MEMFYIQDSRSYLGNDMMWWSIKGQYTNDLSQAMTVTQEIAQRMHDHRPTDIPWPKKYIDERARPVVDMQKVIRSTVENAGITLQPCVPNKKELTHCHHCGAFMNETQRYVCGCPKCKVSPEGTT